MLYTKSDFGRPGDEDGDDEHGRYGYSEHTASEYGRIVHSMSFRRLQGKMQLFPPSESPLLRNRLTHTLEVTDIASRITAGLNRKYADKYAEKEKDPKKKYDRRIDSYIVTTAALAHDLGHPPFGHTGEIILAKLMRDHGSFEGNAQTLRILTRLENRFISKGAVTEEEVYGRPLGLNLLYRTIASIVKYDKVIKPPSNDKEASDKQHPPGNDQKGMTKKHLDKGYYKDDEEIVDKVRAAVVRTPGAKLKTIECQIMDLADDIAYSTYDLEDCMISGVAHPLDLISISEEAGETIAERVTSALRGYGYSCDIFSDEVTLIYAKVWHSLIRENTESDYKFDYEIDKAAYLGWNYNNSLDVARSPLVRRRAAENLIQQAIDAISIPKWNEADPALTRIDIDPQYLLQIEALKHFNYVHTIESRPLQIYAEQAETVLHGLFDALGKKGEKLLPGPWQAYYRALIKGPDDQPKRMRLFCDYISSLTDAEAIGMYARLRGANPAPLLRD
jgi:dGTPase